MSHIFLTPNPSKPGNTFGRHCMNIDISKESQALLTFILSSTTSPVNTFAKYCLRPSVCPMIIAHDGTTYQKVSRLASFLSVTWRCTSLKPASPPPPSYYFCTAFPSYHTPGAMSLSPLHSWDTTSSHLIKEAMGKRGLATLLLQAQLG